MAVRTRNQVIAFRVTLAEARKIREKVRRSGLSQQEYLLQAALEQQILVIHELKPILTELRAWGKNLNQLTVLAHTGHVQTVYLNELTEALGKLSPVRYEEMKILSREAMQKLLIQAKEENYYELFLLELATGLRLGEIAALQWDDLNPTTGELRINKQAGTVGPEVVICEPKTKAAVRTLILPPTVLKVMREYKAKVDSRWMFPSPKKEDSPMRPSSIHLRLHRILDHAGCERVRFHDLRHTFATNALAYGMDIKTLSTILGHVSSATTLNTYSHVTDEMRQRAAVKIDQGIAKVEVNPQEEKPKERTMTTFQARKRWSRKAS